MKAHVGPKIFILKSYRIFFYPFQCQTKKYLTISMSIQMPPTGNQSSVGTTFTKIKDSKHSPRTACLVRLVNPSRRSFRHDKEESFYLRSSSQI